MIKAVLFDMDGTIFDTEGIYRRCWFRAAKDVGFDEDIDLFLERVCGLNYADMTAFVNRVYSNAVSFDILWGRWLECIDEEMARGVLPFKSGTPDILFALKERGIKIALVTSSGQKTVARYLQMSGLEGVFDVIVTGNQVTRGKPHPECFLTAAEKLGIDPASCVVVEDSPNGVRAGHAAGMYTVMVPDLHPCTAELRSLLWQLCDTLTDLVPLIDNENQNTI